MRLTCPNCGAEYEVPDEVIPAAGRDVQCSNCGVTWYQHHPDHMPDESGDDALPEDEAPEVAEPADPDPTPEGVSGDDAAEDDSLDHAEYDEDYDEDYDGDYDEDYDDEEESAPPPAEPRQPLRRRSLDPEVSSILREEAAYEERVRTQETLESQPDLGLDEPAAPSRRTQMAEDRLARAREDSRDEEHPTPQERARIAAASTGATAASRRDLLPDIEEINSTLRRKGDSMRGSGARSSRTVQKQRRHGTRRSFITVLVVLALGASLYLQAPNIGAAVPQLKGPMDSYVNAVDRGRAWLDVKASALAAKLDEMASDDAEALEMDAAPMETPEPEMAPAEAPSGDGAETPPADSAPGN